MAAGKTRVEWALRYIALRWAVLPLRGKIPLTKHGSKDATFDEAMVRSWWATWPDANLGVATGHKFFVLDVDVKKGGEDSFDSLRLEHGNFPDTIQQVTGSGGKHLLFKNPDFIVRNSDSWIAPGIDIRGSGGYIVVAPSIHPETKRRYVWDGIADIEEQAIAAAPAWLLDRLRSQGQAQKAGAKPAAVASTITEGGRNSAMFKLACSLRRKGLSGAEILATLKVSNDIRCSPPLSLDELQACAKSAERYSPDARANVFTMPVKPEPEIERASIAQPCDLLRFLYNDHGNSQRVVAMYGRELRYCPAFKKWLVWDGRRWEVDEADRCRYLTKVAILEFLRQAIEQNCRDAEKFAKASLDSNRIGNAMREAQDQLVVMTADLDSHPFLQTFLNGVVDLRSGTLMPHDPTMLMTTLVHFQYDPTASCPQFQRFVDRIAGATPDVAEAELARSQQHVDFLQKAFGYSLTGATSEKVCFFLRGPPDTGKSTLLATVYSLVRECAVVIQIESLMVKSGGENNNSQADLADLRGARFAMTSETAQGARLDEAKLKRITQGCGKIRAVRKYENPIEFDETHKLFVDANFLPVVRSGDEAIWRRIRAVPFSVVIPRNEQDRELGAKLLAEGEGILAWMVAGAVRWYREGLGTVSAVEETGVAWRSDMNQVGRFVEECCVKDDPSAGFSQGGKVAAKDLYEAYKRWSQANGERYMSQRSFSQQTVDAGCVRRHQEDGNYYYGIGLRQSALGFGSGD